MNPPSATGQRVQLEEFQRKHRTGLLTLLFTDIVESTALKQRLGDRAGAAFFEKHHQLVRATRARFPDAQEIETAGDSFLILFAKPSDAAQFALLVQARLRELSRESAVTVQDRIGIHVGEVVIKEGQTSARPTDLYGIQIDICARVMSLARAGQVLMTRSVFDSARQVLKGEDIEGIGALEWLNHGPYLLKGLDEPVEICEVREAGQDTGGAPAGTEKAQRQVAAGEEQVLGWRPALSQRVPNTEWVLERKLGEGGFGEVWLGRHRTMKERRVFKFCFRADRVRFLKREMTLFRLLKERVGDHPNIVRLLEVYFNEPPFYVEMDYVEGQDLRTWSEERGGVGSVPLEVRLEIVAQVADALQAAHDAGVIHRDVKPSNILVESRGSRVESRSVEGEQADRGRGNNVKAEIQNPRIPPLHSTFGVRRSTLSVKLTDFGIGQVVSEEYLSGITRAGFTQTMMSDSSTSHTGTQLYMAPELLAGKPATIRSDIYSLGVVLFQMLVGDFLRPVTTDWWKEIPDPLLRDDLQHCFAGNPQDRFGSMAQLTKQLRGLPERRAALERREAEQASLERAAYRRGVVRAASLAGVVLGLFAALAMVALKQSQRAQAAAEAERRERTTAQRHLRHLYAANMIFAQQAWEQNNFGNLRQLLEETATYPERGFEWYYWQRQTHLELKTMRGHQGGVRSAAISPDGQRILTASEDRTAKVWETASGRELFALKGHGDWIRSAAFSPDGHRIATGSDDLTARLWDAATGKELLRLQGYGAQIWSVVFSPDGQRIVTGGLAPTASMWEAASGKELLTLRGHRGPIASVAFSSDGQRIVTASYDQTAKVWEAGSGKELFTLTGHTGPILSVALSLDGQRIVTTSWDRVAKVWEATSGKELFTFRGHGDSVLSVGFSPDGQRIVTGSADRTAKVWEAASGKELFTLKGHGNSIMSVAFSKDARQIVTGSMDETAKVWDAAMGKEVPSRKPHSAPILSVGFSPDAQRIVTTSWDATPRVLEAASGKELLTLNGHGAPVRSAAFSPDAQRIVTGSYDQTAKVWEAASGKELFTLKGHSGPVASVAFSRDGQRIATGSDDMTAKLWEASSGKELLTLRGHSYSVQSVTFSPDGDRIVTGSDGATTKIWEAANGKELFTLKGQFAWGRIYSVAFSPDGQRIVTGSDDLTARLWDAISGKELLALKGHAARIQSVAFSPDGRRIVTASWDQTAKVWEAASGKELLTFRGHGAGIQSVVFSADGQRILTGSMDGTTKVFEAASLEQVTDWQKEDQAITEYLAAQEHERVAATERERAVSAKDAGAIRQWLILLPIAFEGGNGARALQEEQVIEESQLRPHAGEAIKVGERGLVWRAVQSEDYLIDFNRLAGAVMAYSVAYAVSYIQSEAAQSRLSLKVGSDDQAKVFLNGRLIWQYLGRRSYGDGQDLVTGVELKAGVNVLVFKVVNEGADWQGSVRFLDADGNTLKGIKVTLTP